MRPSEQLAAILSGKMLPSEADDAVQSWLRLSVYNLAREVLLFPKDARRAQLDRVTIRLRGMVEDETIRLHKAINKNARIRR